MLVTSLEFRRIQGDLRGLKRVDAGRIFPLLGKS